MHVLSHPAWHLQPPPRWEPATSQQQASVPPRQVRGIIMHADLHADHALHLS
jgi:hypothetical protein